jgi:cyclic beta-1,2-glucan synthetase
VSAAAPAASATPESTPPPGRAELRSLDSEIFGVDRLELHAVEVARAHGVPSLGVRAAPLLTRFQETKRAIEGAYAVLGRATRVRRDATPAVEWLLDNAHVIDDQLHEIEEDLPRGYLLKLPRLAEGERKGYPRVYELALDFVGHTDGRVELETLVRYVTAYQSSAPLTIGELWAVPIMLRLALAESVRKLADQELATGDGRLRADAVVERMLKGGARRSTDVALAMAELAVRDDALEPAFVVQLLRRLREHDAVVTSAFHWLEERCAEMGVAPAELTRREHLRQSSAQVSIGHAITSMRVIAALDWGKFFERTSEVERALRGDPAEAYEATDAASRDRYRHAVEDIAARSPLGELAVAQAAVRLAEDAKRRPSATPRTYHVGYYLVDRGRARLEQAVGCRISLGAWLGRRLVERATLAYFGALAIGSSVGVLSLLRVARHVERPTFAVLAALALVLVVPVSEVTITLINWIVMVALPPRILSKLSFERGIPADCRTLVAVPALIGREEDVYELLADLEVRSLANPGKNLHFALVTDFPDADTEERPGEARLLEIAKQGIAALNAREETLGGDRYVLLHRRRLLNAAEGCWMGWERKRGKLDELNRLLRGKLDTSFTVVTAPASVLRGVRYVLTLDADTQLPREVVRRLVGTIAHPLNRAELSASGTRVVAGYAIIQPRVGTTLASTSRSRFAHAYGGRGGIDPYTTAVSDVYQDLFAEGVYIGKALYDVDAFEASVSGRIPENRMLSHDLFEGLYARTALASDIELLDDQPSGYAVHTQRQHRWARGDWQLASWLLPRVPGARASLPNDLSLLARWKIFDNLRRSLLAPCMVGLLAFGWFVLPGAAVLCTAVVALALATPLFARLITALLRPDDGAWSRSLFRTLWADLRANALQLALAAVFLLDQAILMLDAIARALYRIAVGRDLLEWKTASDAERSSALDNGSGFRRMRFGAVASVVVAALAVAWTPRAFLALPFLVAWAVAPAVAAWISKPLTARERPLSPASRAYLRRVARKTWRFFDVFVTAADHWLPPDNYQEDPKDAVAHRTSPTNIGLYMLSSVAARDLGYVTLRELTERLENTLTTIDALELHAGHVLNWYDTTTLVPLTPRYVSTVDSGNLAAHLWTVAQSCRDLADGPIVDVAVLEAAADAIALFRGSLSAAESPAALLPSPLAAELAGLESALAESHLAPPTDVFGWLVALDGLVAKATPLATWASSLEDEAMTPDLEAAVYWAERVAHGLGDAARELRGLAPWADIVPAAPPGPSGSAPWAALLRDLGTVPSAHSVAARVTRVADAITALERAPADAAEARSWFASVGASLAEGEANAASLVQRLARVAVRATNRADGMRFRMLYDEERKLFSIGYDVVAGRLDASAYDLLASEARLASLVAIAKGEVPQEHWFRLGRQLVAAAERRALTSWSGSMFEYLMPLLVTHTYERTLLDETYVTIVRRQREYGAERGVPWGVSESAYNTLDLGLTYQYQAFGVPGLGLKQGLADELVVAPYASALASLVHPDLAAKNLAALAKEGLDGRYGFYEAIDYTPAHVPVGRRGVVVTAFFAHHQGMTLVALDNVLSGDPMQRRFHLDPRVKATELLLQERVPVVAALSLWRGADVAPTTASPDDADGAVEHVVGTTSPAPRAHLLAYGDFSILLTTTGSGWMRWKELDVTRWRDDEAIGASGSFCYVRDADSGAYWSTGYQPTLRAPDHYAASFAADCITLHRRDGDIEILTEVVVSPEHAAEVRRITVTNHSKRARHIELTTYAEVVLATRGADLAHPVFSNMFVETEAAEAQSAVLATRRQRSPSEPTPWVAHVMAVEEGQAGPLEYETSRARFVGRGRTLEAPAALELEGPLSRTTGIVLDPVLALRSMLTIPAGGRARVAFTTAVASSREEALQLAETFRDARASARTFELAWTDARVELRHLGISAAQAHGFQRLASAVVFPSAGLRAPSEVLARNKAGREGLWRYGISGDLPILLVRLDDPESADLLAEVLLAHEFWRLNGLVVDLVILNEEPSSYLQPIQEGMLHAIRKSPTQAPLDQPGGVFLRRKDQMPELDYILLQSVARAVLCASQGSLSRQLRRASSHEPHVATRFEPKTTLVKAVAAPVPVPTLLFWNGLGGFRPDGREYVMVLGDGATTPTPWCNVVANPRFGFVVSESGASYTWSDNSQTHRLTPWSNDPVSDPSGEAIYLRDDDDGAVWSPTPGPKGRGLAYVVRHGQGYSTFELRRGSLTHELTVFAAPDANVKIWRLRLKNAGPRARRISAYGYVEWVLGTTRGANALSVVTDADLGVGAVLATNPASPFPERVAFFAASLAPRGVTGDRQEFLGRDASRGDPSALLRSTLSGRVGAGLDPCAAIHVETTIAPGETNELVFVLGEGDGRGDAVALARAYREQVRAQATLDAVVRRWDEILGAVQVETPDPAFDLLMNRWLLYQTVSCRLWARSACYQSGGAYGFRDQLQDVLATVHAAPELAREHILRATARQFREGDVQHWWHPETGQGVRTRYVDDLLWLPFVVAKYVEATEDRAILDELISFLDARPLEAAEQEAFGTPAATSDKATLYEHCTRALDRGGAMGAHGLPLMGGGDWNDGMNRVGVAGRGESVWMAWFLASTLGSFAEVAARRGDTARAQRCTEEVARLAAAVEAGAWDGAWYRRAYFDDGTPLGASADDECAIDAVAQSWAVISGVADPTRARRAMRSTDERLVKVDDGMILLFTPPFANGARDPGYVKAYPAGLRENGGQYTHGVLWCVLAQTLLGDGDRAGALFDLLDPIRHATTAAQVARYQVEPYVVAADVYAAEGHVGRGGWTWYTGSAAWMYRIGVESMLGVTRHGASLRVAPCIRRSWPGYKVAYRHGASTYRVVVENPDSRSSGVARVELDGKPLDARDVPLADDGREHTVRVVLGAVASTDERRPLAATAP